MECNELTSSEETLFTEPQPFTEGITKNGEIQICTLLSIKTGGCLEDCAYSPKSARNETEVDTDQQMFEILGLTSREAFKNEKVPVA